MGAVLLACALVFWVFACPHEAHAYSDSSSPASVSTQSSSSRAANAIGEASSITLFRFGWVDGKYRTAKRASFSKYDVTGDGKPDAVVVKVNPVAGRPGMIDRLTVQVGGREAYALNAGGPTAALDVASVRLVTLRNNKPFLFVSAFDEAGKAHQVLAAYARGAFSTVVSNDLMNRTGASDASISSVDPTGNKVIVQFEFVSAMTGVSRTSFAYEYAGGKLKRTSNTTYALRFATSSTGAFTKQPRTVARAFTAYADGTLSKKVFTVKAGATVRPLALHLKGKGLLCKVEYGAKKGWVQVSSLSALKGSRMLSGTFGASPLKAAAPAYTAKKRLSVSTLQRYSNHALYLARNEVYARHGMKLSSSELNSYFSKKKWYKPVASTSIKLNKVESANVALMLSIEQHRNSPYTS